MKRTLADRLKRLEIRIIPLPRKSIVVTWVDINGPTNDPPWIIHIPPLRPGELDPLADKYPVRDEL